MRPVGLKFDFGTLVFVRRCMGQATSHARCASEEPLRLCLEGQSAHVGRVLMCSASLTMTLACTLTTRPGGNWRVFRLQVPGFTSLRLSAVIDVLHSRPGK